MTVLRLTPQGPFSLGESSRFLEMFPAGTGAQPEQIDLAFPIDGDWRTVGIRVTQQAHRVQAAVHHNPDGVPTALIRGNVQRVLSLDVDARDYPGVGRRDRVVGRLQARYPGLRPVLFPTPYEAAAWTIIGQRIRMTQASTIMSRLAEELGVDVRFESRRQAAFPSPAVLVDLRPTRGLTARKVAQLRALGRAALDGVLAYDLPHATIGELEQIAQRWRPFRTWIAVLLRTAMAARPAD